MNAIWQFLQDRKNRVILGWVGGGVVVVAGGLWTVATFLLSDRAATTACAQQGGIAAGRDASGNTITIGSGNATATLSGGAVECANITKK